MESDVPLKSVTVWPSTATLDRAPRPSSLYVKVTVTGTAGILAVMSMMHPCVRGTLNVPPSEGTSTPPSVTLYRGF